MKIFEGVDWILLLSAIFLSVIGILMIYSSSVLPESVDLTFVFRQSLFVLFGLVLYLIVTNIDYRQIVQFAPFFYIFILILLGLTFVFGESTRGSVRWIDLKFVTIQASEIAKPIIILTLVSFFSKYPPNKLINTLISLAIAAVPALLVFLQPDLGNALILMFLWVIMVFVAGIKFHQIFLFLITAALTLPFIWSSFKEYQKERLFSFLNPERDPLGSGYNLIQSIIAVGSGGLFGRGFGRGTQSQLNFLPEQKTDFIFATVAEQLGFFGVLLVLGFFAAIIYRIFSIFNNARDNIGPLIVVGVGSLIVIHTFINIGMNLGLLPITGVTLPLLSFGGSSLITVMISLGLVNSVSRYSKRSTV